MMREDAAATGYPSIARVYDPDDVRHKPQSAEKPRPTTAKPFRSAVFDVLPHLCLTPSDYGQALSDGWRNGTHAAAELVAGGRVCERDIASAIAATFGLKAEEIGPDDTWIGWDARCVDGPLPRLVRTCNAALTAKIFLVSQLEDLDVLARLLDEWPDLVETLRIATPEGMFRAMEQRSLTLRCERAEAGLSATAPHLSARSVLSGAQGLFFGSVLFGALALSVGGWGPLATGAHLVGAILFCACVVLRLAAALQAGDTTALTQPLPQLEDGCPTYSILVALHRESEVVASLVANLAALDWPRSRLDVLLVCEADDPATIEAAESAVASQPGFRVVLVPPSLPRTKPKALNVALPLTRGDFIVLYDAEDRPDPMQLRAAHARFLAGDQQLACLQAPLIVENAEGSWLAGQFSLEYAALFRGMLPFLARHGLPMPLGGTSNHFKREALLAVGGWDSHNVAEDADLGIRLCRNGFRIATIDVATFEPAPERWIDWRNQRTRWMKGWVQTWLVHMRHPRQLYVDLGPKGFIALQILFFGMIAASLLHPVFTIVVCANLWSSLGGQVITPVEAAIAALDWFNMFGGYMAFAVLARQAGDPSERRLLRQLFWSVPAYWVLIAYAGLRALVQLIRDPHRWEKTPHGPASRRRAATSVLPQTSARAV